MRDKKGGATENQWEDLRKPGDDNASRKKHRERYAEALADVAMLGPVHPEEKEEIGLMAVEMYAAKMNKFRKVNQTCPTLTKYQFLSQVCRILYYDVRDFEFDVAVQQALDEISGKYQYLECAEEIGFEDEISDDWVSELISLPSKIEPNQNPLTYQKYDFVCLVCEYLSDKISEEHLEDSIRVALSDLTGQSRHLADDTIEELELQSLSPGHWSEHLLSEELPARELVGGERVPTEGAITDFVRDVSMVLYEVAGAAHFQAGVESAVWQTFRDRASITARAKNERTDFDDPLDDEFAFELMYGDGYPKNIGEGSNGANQGMTSGPYTTNPDSERERMLRLCELFEDRDEFDRNFIRSLSERLARVPRDNLTDTFERVDEDPADFPPLTNTLKLSDEELENLRTEFEILKDTALRTAQKLFIVFNDQMGKFQGEGENLHEWAEITRPYFEEENKSRSVPDDFESPSEYREGTYKDPRLLDWGPFSTPQSENSDSCGPRF